ncbi:MAG: hypothetical protein LBR34_05605 [Prevotella sp.]|jgi:two-component SAPR family response regulator|nr:hypothetical protein [Prevotella sp.]
MLKRNILIIILLLLYVTGAFPHERINGLLFSSSKERKNDRTSLVLFDGNELKLKDAFRVNFDFSIWDIKQFGYIFRLIDESKQEISLAFVNFYSEDKIYLDFHSQITHKSVQAPITAQDIIEKRWMPVSFLFDLTADRAEITLNDSTYVCEPVGLKNPSSVKLAFGLYGYNLEVPEAAVRNIQIEQNGNKEYYIPLNETEGEKVHDDENQAVGFVKNPKWIKNRHFFWHEKAALKSSPTAGISYDEKKNRVIVVDNDSAFACSMRYDEKTSLPLNGLLARNAGATIYDNRRNMLYVYYPKPETPDDPTLAIVDMKDCSISRKYAATPQLAHQSLWLGNDDNALYFFGGYGESSFSNTISKYRMDADTLETLDFTGDEICPRYFSALGQGLQPTQLFIMGGIGNESGKREHGGRYLYDLFEVDMHAKQIKKRWDIKDRVQSDFVPCGNIVSDESGSCFYVLCYSQHRENSILQLCKFAVSDGSYALLGDSIYLLNAEPINTSINLFYNKPMREFYAAVRENSEDGTAQVRIYSLSSPPITLAELTPLDKQSLVGMLLLAAVLAFILLIAAWYWVKYRKKESSPKQGMASAARLHQKNADEEAVLPTDEERRKSAILVFGEFTVINKWGKDISYYFSPKLRAVFAFLLLYSLNNENGVSSNQMTSELWPNREKKKAKNTRGVTVSRLRTIFEEISGITLYCQDYMWYLSFDSSFYCDYIEYRKILDRMGDDDAAEDKNMAALYDILRRGLLFPDVAESWIDIHKQKHESELRRILWNYLLKLHRNNEYAKLVKFSDLCFIIDPLDEDVFKLCMHALQKIGKKSQAVLLQNRFVSNYKELMGVEPDMSFLNTDGSIDKFNDK